MKDYLLNVAEVLSQAFNAIVLRGNPNVTVSARCYLNRHRAGWSTAYRAINRVFFWQEDHCRSSWVSDIVFARQAVFELEQPRQEASQGASTLNQLG